MNSLLATTLETLLNQALRWNPLSLQALSKLADKIIRVELSDIDLNFTLFPDEQGIIVLGNYDGEVDVRIIGAPFTLLRLLLPHSTTLADCPDVVVKGNMNIAQQLQHFLKGLDIDWEEQLGQILGNIPAHKLTTLFRHCQNHVSNRFDTLQYNLSEYLQARHLPTNTEMKFFSSAVNTLRDDIEQLEQRIQRLM